MVRGRYFVVFLIALLLITSGCLQKGSPALRLQPKELRKVVSVQFQDLAEAELLRQKYGLEVVGMDGRSVYFFEPNRATCAQMEAVGYQLQKAESLAVFHRVVRVAKRGDLANLKELGVQYIQSEGEQWIVHGNIKQLRALEKAGYVLSPLVDEVRPRMIEVIVTKQEDVQKVSEVNVDILGVERQPSGAYKIIAQAYDYQIERLQQMGFQLERKEASALLGTLTYDDYRDLTAVNNALNSLHSTYSGLTAVVTVGTSINGLPIKALKISSTPGVDDSAKGDVIFFAEHHAREWISVETALYIADELLERYSTDPVLQADMNALQIWIIPVSNPDGYEYTWTTYRLWRKNRRNNGDGTYGVDLNRNWGYQWGLASGSSGSTMDDTYRGTAAFSEPETSNLRNFIQARGNLKCLVSFHSYSELYLRPWSYTNDDPPGESTLRDIVLRNISRIAAVHGHTYGESIWYTSSGETNDYLWGEMRVASFTPELRPRTWAEGNFAPPATEILPCAEENFPAAQALIHDAAYARLYVRDHAGDTGAEPSAVWTGGGWSRAFWVSPDIWTIPEELNQGATVDLNVRINNATGVQQNSVTVDIYYNDPRISLEFPNPDSHLIASRTVNVPAGGTVVTVPWTVPVGTNIWGERHWCVGAVVKQADDEPLTNQVQRTSNIGCKNFETTTIIETGTIMVAAQNFLRMPAELQFQWDEKLLPQGVTISLPKEPIKRRLKVTSASLRKAKLLGAKGFILEPGDTALLTLEVRIAPTIKPGTVIDLNISGGLLPLVTGKRLPIGNGYTYRIIVGKK
jgi:carboxypeptidase T